MKHANSEMIKAVLDNTELAIFCEVVDHGNEDGNYWAVSSLRDLVSCFNKFFVCLPQHKEACLHWLNGGEVEFECGSKWHSCSDWSREWYETSGFTCEDNKLRIKPKKEKRWIATFPWNGNESYVTPKHFRCKESLNCYIVNNYGARDYYQAIEIETEVK